MGPAREPFFSLQIPVAPLGARWGIHWAPIGSTLATRATNSINPAPLCRFFDASRSILEGSTTLRGGLWRLQRHIFPSFFSCFRMHARWRCAKTPDVQKPQFSPGFFTGFKQIAHAARKTKNSTISLLKPVEQSSPPKSCSKPVLERARLYLGGV